MEYTQEQIKEGNRRLQEMVDSIEVVKDKYTESFDLGDLRHCLTGIAKNLDLFKDDPGISIKEIFAMEYMEFSRLFHPKEWEDNNHLGLSRECSLQEALNNVKEFIKERELKI